MHYIILRIVLMLKNNEQKHPAYTKEIRYSYYVNISNIYFDNNSVVHCSNTKHSSTRVALFIINLNIIHF